MNKSTLLCKICEKEMKKIPQSFDAFSFLNPIEMMYCDNKECARYGDVTVAGFPSMTPPLGTDTKGDISKDSRRK